MMRRYATRTWDESVVVRDGLVASWQAAAPMPTAHHSVTACTHHFDAREVRAR
jgi:hypothetical protein